MPNKGTTMRVWFHDEGWPQIGCGVRSVQVWKGWKWVYAKEPTGNRKRFRLSDWLLIERGSKNV